MKPIDVLRDDGGQFPATLKFRKFLMRSVRLCIQKKHLCAVKPVEFGRIRFEETAAQNRFGRVVVLLMIKPVHTAEIRNSAFGGNARAAEEHNSFGFFDK